MNRIYSCKDCSFFNVEKSLINAKNKFSETFKEECNHTFGTFSCLLFAVHVRHPMCSPRIQIRNESKFSQSFKRDDVSIMTMKLLTMSIWMERYALSVWHPTNIYKNFHVINWMAEMSVLYGSSITSYYKYVSTVHCPSQFTRQRIRK